MNMENGQRVIYGSRTGTVVLTEKGEGNLWWVEDGHFEEQCFHAQRFDWFWSERFNAWVIGKNPKVL